MKRIKYALSSILLIVCVASIANSEIHAQTAANKFTEREVAFAGAGGLQLRGTLVCPPG